VPSDSAAVTGYSAPGPKWKVTINTMNAAERRSRPVVLALNECNRVPDADRVHVMNVRPSRQKNVVMTSVTFQEAACDAAFLPP